MENIRLIRGEIIKDIYIDIRDNDFIVIKTENGSVLEIEVAWIYKIMLDKKDITTNIRCVG
jgi:hypothetical protein